MDAQRVSRFREVAVTPVDDLRHETLLEFALGVFVVDTARHHLIDELIQQLMHAESPVRVR